MAAVRRRARAPVAADVPAPRRRRSASPSGSPSCSSPTTSTTTRRTRGAPRRRIRPDLWARARDGLLLNLANSVPASLRGRFARTALFDIDPGQFQLWARDTDLGVGSHDAYLTIGRNLGAPDSPVPLGDVPWQRVWPAVHLPAWPEQPAASRRARYTTVTQWWSDGWTVLGSEVIEGHKRTSFLRVLDLPRRVPVQLELAANIHAEETEDRRALTAAGWHLADPAVVAGTPEAFRRYVQQSRGELSCAKPSYVRTRPGWVSDRTICYLASGRPCVVEATGAEGHLPASAGLRFFRTVDEAAECLRAVERDYAAAARAARELAEERVRLASGPARDPEGRGRLAGCRSLGAHGSRRRQRPRRSRPNAWRQAIFVGPENLMLVEARRAPGFLRATARTLWSRPPLCGAW